MKKSHHYLLITLIASVIFTEKLNAQITTVNTYKNLITVKESRADLLGSPYLYAEWQIATVKFGEGVQPKKESIKYDLLDDILVVKGEGGNEYTFTDPPKEFQILGSSEIYKNGFSAVDRFTQKTFYNVIYDGKVKYLKKDSKIVLESKSYNSASIEYKVADETFFYLVKEDNRPVKVKNNEKSIISLLGKADQLSKYIKENKLDVKTDDGIVKLLTYYDTL
ncbi:hypothetical protein [Pedobacter frigidisoli]|uniref:hypothetical protein n=1 Tax=Pedobacter frigidisoli TaxID=2530455 RepID=UPI00292CBD6E|nr:hypothetical protein [Pedobacter frigidisoli]